jgi:hypothetical protein
MHSSSRHRSIYIHRHCVRDTELYSWETSFGHVCVYSRNQPLLASCAPRFTSVLRVSPLCSAFHLCAPHFTSVLAFHLCTPRFTSVLHISPLCSAFHLCTPRFTSVLRVSPLCSAFHLCAPRFTSVLRVSPLYSAFHLCAPRFTWYSSHGGSNLNSAHRLYHVVNLLP